MIFNEPHIRKQKHTNITVQRKSTQVTWYTIQIQGQQDDATCSNNVIKNKAH